MINIENTDIYGWEAAIRGMRNPMNSWDMSDSHYGCGDTYSYPYCGEDCCGDCEWVVGANDIKLMKNLSKAGNDHSKFLRMITVTLDITAPLYWWKEFDTYKVGTVANSCSTMHKIHAKEFELDDFSHEHLTEGNRAVLNRFVECMEANRKIFLALEGSEAKEAWYQMIQLLPSSFNQKRTVQLNYQVLKTMYNSRKNHKLDEWRDFCKWVESLPYSELITRKGERNEENTSGEGA